MRTPNYYVQQMYGLNAGTDVLSLKMDGKPVTGQQNLYATAALDSRTGEIIVKIVNNNAEPTTVALEFNGLKKQRLLSGLCTFLQTDNLKAINTLDAEKVIPQTRPVQVKEANRLNLELPPYYFGVYRLQVGR